MTAFMDRPKSLAEEIEEETAGDEVGLTSAEVEDEGAPRMSTMGEEVEKDRRTAGLKNQSCGEGSSALSRRMEG